MVFASALVSAEPMVFKPYPWVDGFGQVCLDVVWRTFARFLRERRA